MARTTRADPDLTVVERYRLARYVVLGIIGLISLILLPYPLEVIDSSIKAVAGQDTNFNVNVAISITVALGLALTGAGFKIMAQRRELVRLRRHVRDLEAKVLSSSTGSTPAKRSGGEGDRGRRSRADPRVRQRFAAGLVHPRLPAVRIEKFVPL